MKIIQHKDGSCDFEFTDQEIDVIDDKGKIIFGPEGIKEFGKTLFEFSFDSIKKLDTSLQTLQSHIDYKINPEIKD